MRETSWGSANGEAIPFNGQPWNTSYAMISRGEDLMHPEGMDHPLFHNNLLKDNVRRVKDGLDPWLAELGYIREGNYYRVKENNTKTIVLASHAGASSAVLSHLFNLPFPFVCTAIQPNFTAISVITFKGEPGNLILPGIELLNDARHLAGIEIQNVFGQ